MTEQDRLNGLEGWLILVGFGVVFTPIRLLYLTVTAYLPVFVNGTWEVLTTSGSEYYNPLWAPVLFGEIGFNLLVILLSCYLIYLFFSKRRAFPRLFIFLVLISLVFILLDAWVISQILTDEPMFDPDTMKELVRTLIGVIIWVPYMLVSKRVKATFVNP